MSQCPTLEYSSITIGNRFSLNSSNLSKCFEHLVSQYVFRNFLRSSRYLVTGCFVYWQSTKQSLLMLDWSVNIILEGHFNIFALPALDTNLEDYNLARYWYLIDHQSTSNKSIRFFTVHINIFRLLPDVLPSKYHRKASVKSKKIATVSSTTLLFEYLITKSDTAFPISIPYNPDLFHTVGIICFFSEIFSDIFSFHIFQTARFYDFVQ